MPIELIEPGTINSAVLGWGGSRDLDADVSIPEVAKLDASVNELPTAMFYFRDMMILERELVVTPRNHVIWARTSRVDDPRKFTVPLGFEKTDAHNAIRYDMEQQHQLGIHQDQWRMRLPLCAQTSWTTRLSYRDAIRLCAYFVDVATAVTSQNAMLALRLIHTSHSLQWLLPRAYGVTSSAVIEAVSKFKRLPIQPMVETTLGTANERMAFGNVVSVTLAMPLALRAQLVRHREITVADNLVAVLAQAGSEQLPISTPLFVQAVALASTWATVLGKRTCWMAQADLWAPLARLYGTDVEGLPCADGVCPYAEDAKLRLAGKDPGAPCPRYSNLTRTPLNDGQWEAALTEANGRPNPLMWREELGVGPPQEDCKHTGGCPHPVVCTGEGHCDAKFNGYR